MMKNLTKGLLIAVLVLIAATGMTSPVSAEGKRGGTLVVIAGGPPRHLNPAVQSGINTGMPGTQIFASPLRYDENWTPHPYLAKSWNVSGDGMSVTLKLVDGATFHDGKPITSEDVAFSLMTVKANHPFQTMFAPVTKVETPDPLTAIIRMDKPHPAILLAMSSALLPVIPKHIFDDGQDMKTHPMNMKPIGSGPFKFVEYRTGEHVIVKRNESFFIKGRPYLDRIIFRYIEDPANRLMSLERQEGHMYPFLSTLRDISHLKRQPHLNVTSKGYAAIGPLNWLAFNCEQKPVSDKRVRKAIAYAIDREFIIKKLHLGLSTPATGPIVPGSPYYSADVEKYDLDLEKANKLLDEAGYPKGAEGIRFPLVVDYFPGEPEQQKMIVEYLKSQLQKIGIDVQIRSSPDFPSWAQHVSNWDFWVTGDLVYNWGDPVIGVHRTYLTSNIRKGVIWSNTQKYSNPKVDEILAKATIELNMEKRKALYAEFQKIVVDDIPIYFINTIPYHTAYHKNLRNVVSSIWGAMSPMDEVYWEKQPK